MITAGMEKSDVFAVLLSAKVRFEEGFEGKVFFHIALAGRMFMAASQPMEQAHKRQPNSSNQPQHSLRKRKTNGSPSSQKIPKKYKASTEVDTPSYEVNNTERLLQHHSCIYYFSLQESSVMKPMIRTNPLPLQPDKIVIEGFRKEMLDYIKQINSEVQMSFAKTEADADIFELKLENLQKELRNLRHEIRERNENLVVLNDHEGAILEKIKNL